MADADHSSEIWKSIPDAPNYSASSHGRIRREKSGSGTRAGKLLVQNIGSAGRAQVSLSHDGKLRSDQVHRLVAKAFIGLPPADKPFVCHKDGNHLNNIPENLYYGDARDNGADAVVHGTIAKGSRNGNSKLTEKQVDQIINDPRSASAVAREIGISISTACRIRKGESWKHAHNHAPASKAAWNASA